MNAYIYRNPYDSDVLSRTSDGKIFKDHDEAVNHQVALDFYLFGDLGRASKIYISDDAGASWH